MKKYTSYAHFMCLSNIVTINLSVSHQLYYATISYYIYCIKPEPGDYSYSGMHDHGPLPQPKEGGNFSQIIGLVNEAKKASDLYLTEVIEKEKALIEKSKNSTIIPKKSENNGQQQQKRQKR